MGLTIRDRLAALALRNMRSATTDDDEGGPQNGSQPGLLERLYRLRWLSAAARRAGRSALWSVFGQSVRDAPLDRLVLRPQGHFIVLRVLFHLSTASRCRLLYGCLVGLVRRYRKGWE